jgi:hypothetical protein
MKELLQDTQKVAFEKLINSYIKKHYPFLTKIEFTEYPQMDDYEISFKANLFFNYKSTINNERILRHSTKEDIEKIVQSSIEDGIGMSEWEARLFFKFSPIEFKDLIMNLLSYVATDQPVKKRPFWYSSEYTFKYLIDPITYVP